MSEAPQIEPYMAVVEETLRADEREQIARWVEISIPVTHDGYARIEEITDMIRSR